MASIDKIYATKEQRDALADWLQENKPEYLKYLYYWDWPPNDTREHPISNFPEHVDVFLYNNCPLQFVKNRIAEQYGESLQVTLDADKYYKEACVREYFNWRAKVKRKGLVK